MACLEDACPEVWVWSDLGWQGGERKEGRVSVRSEVPRDEARIWSTWAELEPMAGGQELLIEGNNHWMTLTLESWEGNGTPLQYSCLENPMDGGAWWAAVHGIAKIPTRLSDFTFTFYFLALEKEMTTHSSVLAWRIPGTGEPGGL